MVLDGPPMPDPMIGQQLGKDYQVLECIGIGGMGVVYLVEHAALRKRFAAKVLSKELATDAEARGRFQTEAHAASQLEHENIVNLTDYGVTADGRPYLIMELLRGQTLDQRLAAGPLPLEEIVAIVIPVARGLAEAHAEGIVHRDVKPENVFLTQRSGGRWGVKVLDFGIAKTPVKGTKLTKTGQALGSPMYMAPEACRGDEVDHRADIYSLGVLMYLLWCGRVPFDDDNLLKVLQMQVSDPVPAPRTINPEISPAIEAVILRALEKDADRRFLSIAMLLAELETALPEGADRLLIEAARGTTSMRALSEYGATPMPVRAITGSPRRSDPVAIAQTQPAAALIAASAPTPSATRVDDPVPGRPRRRGLLVPAAVVLVIAGVALFALTRPGPSRPAVEPSPIAAGPPVVTPPVVTPPAAVASQPPVDVAIGSGPAGAPMPPPAPIAPPPAPRSTQLVVRTQVPGAQVSLDGRPLGATPLTIAVPAVEGSAVLRVERAGFAPWTREIELGDPVEIDANLIALRPTVPPRRPPARPPRSDKRTAPAAPSGPAGGSAPALEIRTRR